VRAKVLEHDIGCVGDVGHLEWHLVIAVDRLLAVDSGAELLLDGWDPG
jgi:hypothetical protein